jgi:hypothetical protein
MIAAENVGVPLLPPASAGPLIEIERSLRCVDAQREWLTVNQFRPDQSMQVSEPPSVVNYWVSIPPDIQEAIIRIDAQQGPTKNVLQAVVGRLKHHDDGLQGLLTWLRGLTASVQRHAGWEPHLQHMQESLRGVVGLSQGLQAQRNLDTSQIAQNFEAMQAEIQNTRERAEDSQKRLSEWGPACEEIRLKQIHLEGQVGELRTNLTLRVTNLESSMGNNLRPPLDLRSGSGSWNRSCKR